MENGSIFTANEKKKLVYRNYTANGSLSATLYLVATKFKVGIKNGTPNIADTNLDYAVPITDGTVNDPGDNNFAGTGGGDASTDNTTYFKEGAGVTDATAQNLIANDTSVTKTWTLNPLDANVVTTKPFALWLRITDAAALAKFKSSSTALEIRFRTNGDGATLYYSYVRTQAQLAVGWNWVSSNTALVSALTEGAGGAPSGNIDEFVIIVTTNNATDEFVTSDVVYDLLRQWATSDLIKSFVTGYPTLDLVNFEATTRCYLTSTEALGFNINGTGVFNEDSSVLMLSEDTMGADSKSSTDEFVYVLVDRVL